MVLATHPLSGCMVSGASEEGQFVEWVVGCAESKTSVIKVVLQDSIQQRSFEQFADFPELLKESQFAGFSPGTSFSSVRSVSRC